MADYISREAALDMCDDDYDRIRIRGLLAADVRPIMHGEWWPAKDGYYGHVMCSACHKIESHKTDYCPNCGTDMRVG